MLRELRPYVKVGMTIEQFEKKTGLSRGVGIGSGPPGTMDYLNLKCGLILGVGPSRKIRIIRRSEKTINGKKFDRRSISAPGYSDSGYGRWYPN